MSNFPNALDDDTTLPIINDNLTDIGAAAINALRDAVFNIEQNIGLGAAGTTPSIAARLGLLINPDGTPNASAITSLGLVTLPITNNQIADHAGIPETKLHLDYRTQDLFNYIRDLSGDVNTALGWISVSGSKLEPHLMGALYRHTLPQIDVTDNPSLFLNNVFRSQRDNTTAYSLVNDINNELLAHQWADGSIFGTLKNITTNDGSTYPSYYAHTASGIFLQSSGFAVIPQTVQDLQALADFIDQASIFLYGTRIQNLYSNGISRTSRSSILSADGYGQSIVPSTPAIAYLAVTGMPLDDIATGDDMIKFVPTDGYTFTSQFALVRIGDIIRVNYGSVEVAFVVKEKKYSSVGGNSIYEIRIAGKNLFNTTTATARIDRPLFNTNKYGVLAVASANNVYAASSSTLQPSLIVGSPRGAQALGNGFNPDQFDPRHYLLYLSLYPTGNPTDGYVILPPVDVTGDRGSRPGSYTLQSIVDATNIAFRQPGFNYRFIAFQYQGQFGIMLADAYLGSSFSIISAAVVQSGSSAGQFDPVATSVNFSNNVVGILPANLSGTFAVNSGLPTVNTTSSQVGIVPVGSLISFGSQLGVSYIVFSVTSTIITLTSNYNGNSNASTTANLPVSTVPPDPLGLGPFGSNVASPPFNPSYVSTLAAQIPTQVFIPLKRNTYYVNGTEREKLNTDVNQILDVNGDGYWIGTIDGYTIIPASRVEVTYNIPLNLSTSKLSAGKTIVVQPLSNPTTDITNYGRFTIKSINVQCSSSTNSTNIVVYDGVHGTVSPSPIAPIGTQVAIYFSSDSVSFNAENASDINSVTPFRRYFENFIDQNGNTFTGERARIYSGGIPGNNVTSGGITYYYLLVNGGTTTPNRLFASTGLQSISILNVSPKLRGYQFGSITKINFSITSVNVTSGTYSGFLSRFDDTNLTYSNMGPIISGYQGQVTRFYDETNIDFIDVIFDINSPLSFNVGDNIDFQLFPTLSLDQEIMQLSSCQVADSTGPNTPQITYLTDKRQFGNISEQQLSTSALSYLSTAERLVFGSAVLRGFDLETTSPNPNPNAGQIFLTGGVALINGNVIQMNAESVTIPIVYEVYLSTNYNINWLLCVNDKGEYEAIPLLDVDTTLPSPSTSNRIVKLYDVVSTQSYNSPALLFSDFVNSRKDLVPLYIVTSHVLTGASPTISLTVSDARRYINNLDTNLPLKLTSVNSQGNFRSVVSIFNWIKYNSFYNGTVIVKGANNVTGLISTPTTLSFNSNVTIDGQDNATLTFGSPVVLGSNLTLQNMTLLFNVGVSISPGATNLVLDNCNIVIAMPTQSITTPLTRQYVFDFTNSHNISITNCTISVSFGDNTTAGAVFRLTNASDFIYDDNPNLSVIFRNIVASGTSVPGDIFIIKNSDNVFITNSSFIGNFNQLVRNTNSNNLLLDNFTATSNYQPYNGSGDPYNTTTDPDGIADGLPSVTYNPSNFVNNGRGYIYSNVSSTLNNLTINNGTFNFSPLSTANVRFSFINIELSSNTAILNSFTITNCNFNNTKFSNPGTVDDYNSAIAIINSSPAASSTAQQPSVQNLTIENNFCNRNQSFILTSVTSNGHMIYPGLATQNCSISNNTVGTIGYWISAGSKVVSTSPNVNSLSDKVTDLIIENNNCHFIASMDHTGNFWLVSKVNGSGTTVNQSAYPSGYVSIRTNHANWIHTGIAFEESSSLQIIDNSLCAYDQAYISNLGEIFPNIVYGVLPTIIFSFQYAIVVASNRQIFPTTQVPGEGNDSSVIISGNTTGTGYWLNTSSGQAVYQYGQGYILCQSSCIVSKNVLKGVAETLGQGSLIVVGGLNNIVSNNMVYRQGKTISAYILFANVTQNSNSYSWDGAASTGIVTDNFFDSSYIDNVTTNIMNNDNSETLVRYNTNNTAASKWTITRNKNQIAKIAIPLTTGLAPYGPFTSGATPDGVFVDLANSGTNFYVGLAPSATGFGYKSLYTYVFDNYAPIVTRYLGWLHSLDTYVPVGTQILLVQVGLKNFSSVVETPVSPSGGFDSKCNLYLNKYTANPTALLNMDSWAITPGVTPDPNILNDTAAQQTTPVSSTITGGQMNATSSTLIASIDTTTLGPGNTDISSSFQVGTDKNPISISVDFRYRLSNLVDTEGEFYFSPVSVKYRW